MCHKFNGVSQPLQLSCSWHCPDKCELGHSPEFVSSTKLWEFLTFHCYFPLMCFQKYYTISQNLMNTSFYLIRIEHKNRHWILVQQTFISETKTVIHIHSRQSRILYNYKYIQNRWVFTF
jgi:hypothetical protein